MLNLFKKIVQGSGSSQAPVPATFDAPQPAPFKEEGLAMELTPLAAQIAAWQAGIQSEINFWTHWFATRGIDWPEDFNERLASETPLQPWIVQGMEGKSDLRILDVGAGPMTMLGKQLGGRRIDIVASDPLAPIYSQIATAHGVQRPIETVQAFAEDLSCYYSPRSFDIVHCRNALDHSFDPMRGLLQMFLVAKLGGRIVLQHAVDEAVHGEYLGFHQWNFTEENGDFIIWNPAHRINVTKQLSPYADIMTSSADRWIVVIMHKMDDTNFDPDPNARVADILAAVLLASVQTGNDASER